MQWRGPEDQVHVFDAGEDVTVYFVMVVPFVEGFVQVTVALFVPRVAAGLAGADGTCFVGLTPVRDFVDCVPVPTPLVAETVKWYVVPSVSPSTVQVSGPDAHVQVFAPGVEVTVYFVMGVPFVVAAVQVTVALS